MGPRQILLIWSFTEELQAGVAAAIQASKNWTNQVVTGRSLLIDWEADYRRALDRQVLATKQAIGGIAREFNQNIRSTMKNPVHWKWANPGRSTRMGPKPAQQKEKDLPCGLPNHLPSFGSISSDGSIADRTLTLC